MAKTYSQWLTLLADYLTGNDPAITSLTTGGRVRTLLESVAQQLADLSQAIDTQLYSQAQTGLFDAFNFPRLPAVASEGVVVLTGAAGSAFPSGGLVSITPATNTNTLTFEALDTYTIASGQTIVSGSFQCTSTGVVGNVNAGTITTIVTVTPGFLSATNPNAFTGGANQETDAARQARFNTYISTLSTGTPSAIEEAAVGVPGVVGAAVVESPYLSAVTLTGSTYTDNTDIINMPYNLGVSALGGTVNAGNAFMLASPVMWTDMYVDIISVGSGLVGTWEYYNNSNLWTPLTIVGDNTNSLTSSGVVSWELPSDWEFATFASYAGWWIRFAVSSGGGVSPTVMFVEGLNPPVGFATVAVAASGQQAASSGLLQSVQQAVDTVRPVGITINVVSVEYSTLGVTLTATVAPGTDSTAIEQAVVSAIENYLNGLAIGAPAYLQQIEQVALSVLGGGTVLSVNVSTPSNDTYVEPTSEIISGVIEVTTQFA